MTTPAPNALPALLLCVALAACQREPAAPECALPVGATVVAIGDSITRGHGADGQGYPEQLQALLAQRAGREHVVVHNLGVDGERAAGLLARIDATLARHAPAVVLITTGGNDLLRRGDEAQLRRDLQAIVDRVHAAGAHAVVFAVPRPSVAAAAGIAGDHEVYAGLAPRAQVIAGVVARVLARDELRADRIHPNRDGYALMARAAFEALERCR